MTCYRKKSEVNRRINTRSLLVSVKMTKSGSTFGSCNLEKGASTKHFFSFFLPPLWSCCSLTRTCLSLDFTFPPFHRLINSFFIPTYPKFIFHLRHPDFLPQSKNLPHGLIDCSKLSLGVVVYVCVCVGVIVWPCDRLGTCPGCAPPSPNSSRAPRKGSRLRKWMDGCIFHVDVLQPLSPEEVKH